MKECMGEKSSKGDNLKTFDASNYEHAITTTSSETI
jgi:hypothetical protein